jgi:ketosteroid isomerase-like protein
LIVPWVRRYPSKGAGNGVDPPLARYWTRVRAGGSEALTHDDLLREGYDAFNRRDSARLRELMVEDFRWHEAEEVPGRKDCRTADEFAAYLDGFDRLWDEFSFEVLKLSPGDRKTILATVRVRGKGKASPDAFELTIHHVWRFREGRVARMDAFLDRRDAADAAGVR